MKKLSLFVILVTATALLLSACGPKTAEATTATPQASQPQGIIAEGRLQPANVLDQAFTLSGQVAEVLVQDGETVEVGQPLARLAASPEAQLALARAKQEYLAAQQVLDALQTSAQVTLTQSRLTLRAAQEAVDEASKKYDADDSEDNKALLDAAQAKLKLAGDNLAKLETHDGIDPDQQAVAQTRLASANAALESAQALIDAQVLQSSLAGVVVDLALQSGQLVTAGVPVLTVADYSAWLVKTDNLKELEVGGLRPGQKVSVVLDALPDLTLAGEVTRINARYEEKRGDITYTVTIRLDGSDPQMRWGMTAAVTFLP